MALRNVVDQLAQLLNHRWPGLRIGIALLVTAISAALLLWLPGISDGLLKSVSQGLKYGGLALTTFLSVYSLHQKTYVESHDSQSRTLTAAGRRYRDGLILLAAITISSAYMENVADKRLKDQAEKQGNKHLEETLQAQYRTFAATVEGQLNENVTPKLEEQTRRLGKAGDRILQLQGRLDASTRAVRTQVQRTEESLKLANLELEHFYVDVVVQGVSPDTIPAVRENKDLEKEVMKTREAVCREAFSATSPPTGTFDVTRLLSERMTFFKPWELPENDCSEAFAEQGKWSRSVGLLGFLDPTGHLDITLTLHFDGFTIRGETQDDCDLSLGYINESYRCLNFDITTREASMSHADMLFGAAQAPWRDFNFGLSLTGDQWGRLFADRKVFGRDTSPQTLEMTVCDGSLGSQQRQLHLDQFRSDLSLAVLVLLFEKQSGENFWRQVRFRKDSAKTKLNDQCRSFVYISQV